MKTRPAESGSGKFEHGIWCAKCDAYVYVFTTDPMPYEADVRIKHDEHNHPTVNPNGAALRRVAPVQTTAAQHNERSG